MKKLFAIFFFFILSLFTKAQIYSSFERGFGTSYDDEGSAICVSQGSFYLVAGYTLGYSAGTDRDFYLVQFNNFGGVNFSQHCGSTDNESASGVVEYSNGDIYVVGTATRPNDPTYERIVLAKFDMNGNVNWWKQIDDTTQAQEANELVILPNGEIAICGRVISGSQSRALIIISDTSGNVLRHKEYSINQNENFTDLIVNKDNEIAVCTSSGSQELIVYGLDLNGDSLWRYNSIITAGPIRVLSIVQLNDSNYVVGGDIYLGWTNHIYYHSFDRNRNTLQQIESQSQMSTLNDLAGWSGAEFVSSATQFYNNVPIFGEETYDYTNSTVGQQRYLRPLSYSHFLYSTTLGATAIVVNSQNSNDVISLTGYTTLTGNGSKDVAIVHTNDALGTKCQTDGPIISAKGSSSLCPGDSTLISLDANHFVYEHWVNLEAPYTQEIGQFGDSAWVNTPGHYFLIGLDADSSIWISNEVTIVASDTSRATVTVNGSLGFCQLDGETLSITLNDLQLISMQWFCNGDSIPGATTQVLNIDSSGIYSCVYNKICRTDTTENYYVNVSAPPGVFIDWQNSNGMYMPWCNGNNSIQVQNVSYYTYQWERDGVVVSTSYFCQISAEGQYSITTSNSCGSTYTNAGFIPEWPLPYPVTTFPADTNLCFQDTVELYPSYSVGVSSWYLDNQPVSSTYSNLYYASSAGEYYFLFTTNGMCTNDPIQSGSTFLTQDTLPSSILFSIPVTNTCDTLYGSASSSAQNIQYNLYHDGTFSGSYFDSIPVVTAGAYWVEVHDATCSIRSDTISITNLLPPLQLTQDSTLCVGDTITIGLPASTSFNYQWSNGDTNSYTEIYSAIQDTFLLVLTVSDSGICSNSDSTLLIFDLCSQISESVFSMNVLVYPTVFDEFLYFKNSDINPTCFVITDVMGREIVKGKFQGDLTLNTNNFSSGAYFVHTLNDGGGKKTVKILKQ